MKNYIQAFTTRTIEQKVREEDSISYYDVDEEMIAEVYLHEDGSKGFTFYPELLEQEVFVKKEQLAPILERVKQAFEQQNLVQESICETDDSYVVELRMQEPVHGVNVRGTGINVTINFSGQLEEVFVYANDVDIKYPQTLISKDEAKRILQEQQLLKLTISAEHGWRYMYGQNFDLYGISPDGTVRFWHNDPSMKGAGYEELPEVERIADFEAYLTGGRTGEIIREETEEMKSWCVDSEEEKPCPEQALLRACRILKTLVGEEYKHYKLEVYPNLFEELGMSDYTFQTYRFVYLFSEVALEFYAVSVNIWTETNQVESVWMYPVPYDKLASLEPPKLTLEEANVIAKKYVDIELTLETDLKKRNEQSFVYMIDYPTSPTGGHIQYVDTETGEIYWVETGW